MEEDDKLSMKLCDKRDEFGSHIFNFRFLPGNILDHHLVSKFHSAPCCFRRDDLDTVKLGYIEHGI